MLIPGTPELQGHVGIAILIRNTKPKGADGAMNDTQLQASPEEIKSSRKLLIGQ